MVKRLDLYGFHVYAGCLFGADGDGGKTLLEECSSKVKVFKMDVTSSSDVESVVNEIAKSGFREFHEFQKSY